MCYDSNMCSSNPVVIFHSFSKTFPSEFSIPVSNTTRRSLTFQSLDFPRSEVSFSSYSHVEIRKIALFCNNHLFVYRFIWNIGNICMRCTVVYKKYHIFLGFRIYIKRGYVFSSMHINTGKVHSTLRKILVSKIQQENYLLLC